MGRLVLLLLPLFFSGSYSNWCTSPLLSPVCSFLLARSLLINASCCWFIATSDNQLQEQTIVAPAMATTRHQRFQWHLHCYRKQTKRNECHRATESNGHRLNRSLRGVDIGPTNQPAGAIKWIKQTRWEKLTSHQVSMGNWNEDQLGVLLFARTVEHFGFANCNLACSRY